VTNEPSPDPAGLLVLGIDPGSLHAGYGVVREEMGGLAALDFGVIQIPGKRPIADRLKIIYDRVAALIVQHRPSVVSLEDVFFSQNVKSALRLGQARAAVILAAANNGVRVVEYSPLAIKQSVVGYGRADKDQVKAMVKVLLNLDKGPARADASDALAAAICHIHSAGWNEKQVTFVGEPGVTGIRSRVRRRRR
jgi:crossover junction endodeoxyribonuclease RuvC